MEPETPENSLELIIQCDPLTILLSLEELALFLIPPVNVKLNDDNIMLSIELFRLELSEEITAQLAEPFGAFIFIEEEAIIAYP